MKVSKFLLGLVAIVCIACAKPETNVEPVQMVPTGAIVGTFEKVETKASFGSDMSFLWSEEDAVKVLTSKGTREFVLANGAGQSTASFVGSLGDDETLGNVLAYPYDAAKALTTTSVEFNLPAQYTYTQSFTFGSGSDRSVILPCYAIIEGKSFTVKHLGGYIVYEISNIPATATKFVLKTTNGKRINGVFTADLIVNSAAFAQAEAANAEEKTVEINFPAGASTTQCFIIPVPQGEYSWVWDMYTETDKKVGHGRLEATTVGRNCIVGQREQCAAVGEADNIVNFEDEAFKGYCVANFDADNDGEISENEALAVTEISASNLNIASLIGIEYFRNLISIDVSFNKLTAIDLSNCTKLETLDVSQNESLANIDMSLYVKLIVSKGLNSSIYKVGQYVEISGVTGIVYQMETPMIVSLDETNAIWGYVGETIDATNNKDGKANTAKIPNSPAVKWCKAKGEDWYFPAIEELKTIYNQKSTLNTSLSKVGGTRLGLGRYWSSTEAARYGAYYFDFQTGYKSTYYKEYSESVRAVRAL